MIGGIDIILSAPAKVPATDLIIGRMREFWPEGSFQDANSSDLHRLSDAWVSIIGTLTKEFFVFRDAAAAARWDELGAVDENSNTMLHFLIGDPEEGNRSVREVTLVCDNLTAEIQALVTDLERTFCPALLRLAA